MKEINTNITYFPQAFQAVVLRHATLATRVAAYDNQICCIWLLWLLLLYMTPKDAIYDNSGSLYRASVFIYRSHIHGIDMYSGSLHMSPITAYGS